MKRIILTLCFIALFLVTANLWGKDNLLKIPVNVISENSIKKNLTLNDFELFVNGKKEIPAQLTKHYYSLNQPAIKRNFILALNITEYTQQIEEGIAYFARVRHFLFVFLLLN